MITWFSNVISGRFRHWNDTNNAYVSALVERAQQFPPAIEPLFIQLTAASYVVVDSLVGPDQGRKRIIKKDSKQITAEQFRSLHHLNIWTFMALFGYQNPQFRDSFFAACKDFIGIQENEKRVAQAVLQMEKLDVATICSALFPEITRVLDYEGGSILDWLLLTPSFSLAYSQAVEAYKDAIIELE
jgi:hypothetical protein